MIDPDLLESLLIHAGSRHRPLTYGEVLRHFGQRVSPVRVAALCRALGEVERRVAARGGPDLACLVVRRSDGLPGAGYFAGEAAEEMRRRKIDAARLVRERQARAFAWCGKEMERQGSALPPEIDFLGDGLADSNPC